MQDPADAKQHCFLGLRYLPVSSGAFDEYLQEHIFEPLGMTDTFFSVPEEKFDRFLPNHYWDREAKALKTMGPRSYDQFRDVTLYSGGGGLVGTAMDYMRFAEMLRSTRPSGGNEAA